MGMMPARLFLSGAALCFLGSAGASAQHSVDPETFERGQALYEANCSVCHQETGAGTTPVFPELRGNETLSDPYVLVSKVYQGLGNMPPFPTLSPEDITAIASYVGNAWGNNFGAPTQDEVEAVLADFDEPQDTRTIWDGVYTKAQAKRGQEVSRAPCGLCHGRRMNGAPDDSDMVPGPALARAKFLREWDGRSLGTLFTYSISTMPQSNPGFMPPEDYAATIAYMLELSGAPAGDEELPSDAWDLAHILIKPEP